MLDFIENNISYLYFNNIEMFIDFTIYLMKKKVSIKKKPSNINMALYEISI